MAYDAPAPSRMEHVIFKLSRDIEGYRLRSTVAPRNTNITILVISSVNTIGSTKLGGPNTYLLVTGPCYSVTVVLYCVSGSDLREMKFAVGDMATRREDLCSVL